jgi:hypothetical protein
MELRQGMRVYGPPIVHQQWELNKQVSAQLILKFIDSDELFASDIISFFNSRTFFSQTLLNAFLTMPTTPVNIPLFGTVPKFREIIKR